MRTALLTLLVAVAGLQIHRAQNFQWARSVQSPGEDISSAIGTDAAGNVYTAGRFEGIADFDPGPGTYTLAASTSNIFVSKLDLNGNFVWAANFECVVPGPSGCGDNGAEHLAVDAAGNVYITGYFCWGIDFDPGPGTFLLSCTTGFDNFLVKLNSNGSLAWAKAFGNTFSGKRIEPRSLALDAAQNLYIGGDFKDTVDFDLGPATYTLATPVPVNGYERDGFVLKLDGAGNFIWAKQIGSSMPAGNSVAHIATDGSGNVLYTGYAGGMFTDLDPGPGTYTYCCGSFLSKLDANGNFLWAKPAVGRPKTDASKNIYLAGLAGPSTDFDPGPATYTLASHGLSDISVCKLDSNGNFLWAKMMGGPDYERLNGAAVDMASGIYIIGDFVDTLDMDPGLGTYTLASVNGAFDVFIARLDASGNFGGAIQLGGVGYDVGNGIACHTGNVYSTGQFSDMVDFDPSPGSYNLTAAPSGWRDIFVHKMGTLVGLSEQQPGSLLSLYPNPTNGRISCRMQNNALGNYVITDVTGQEVQKGNIGNTSPVIDLAAQASGLYFITIKTDKQQWTQKIVLDK